MNKSFAILAATAALVFAGASQAAQQTGSGETSMTPTTTSGALQISDSNVNDTRVMGAAKAKKAKVAKKRATPMAQTGSGETSMTPTTKN